MTEIEPGRDQSGLTAEIQGQEADEDSETPEVEEVQTCGASATAPDTIQMEVRFFARHEHGEPHTASVEYEVSEGTATLFDVSSQAPFADEIRAVLEATDEVYRHPSVGEVNGIEELKTAAHSETSVKA